MAQVLPAGPVFRTRRAAPRALNVVTIGRGRDTIGRNRETPIMPMNPFRLVFPRIAQDECRTLTPRGHGELADHTFLLDEFYCSEPGCDCRRVVLNVIDTDERRHVATLNYGFDPPNPPWDEDGQLFLDPLNPQSASSAALLKLTRQTIEFDAAYPARLRRHYRMWKRAVDDRTHPQHERSARCNAKPTPRAGPSPNAASSRRSRATHLAHAAAAASTSIAAPAGTAHDHHAG